MPTSVGRSIPAGLPHGISVSLPLWKDNVSYEEGEAHLMDNMENGYPRFFIHKKIQQLQTICERKFGVLHERCILFPSYKIAEACRAFMHAHSPDKHAPVSVRIAHFTIHPQDATNPISAETSGSDEVDLYIVFFPADAFSLAKQFWQHTGAGISSRLAERCLSFLPESDLHPPNLIGDVRTSPVLSPSIMTKPRNKHYSTPQKGLAPPQSPKPSLNTVTGTVTSATENITPETSTYLEERYGRNLPASAALLAKRALRRRIAGVLVRSDYISALSDSDDAVGQSVRGVNVSEDGVFLFPCGMNAIWHAHQVALNAFPPAKSVCFGFPYTDTFKILQKWGPGCHFFGHGLDTDIDAFETLLASSSKISSSPPILALFCEFPSNPLLRSPNLVRLRELADQYNFLIVVDETIGSFANVEVLPFADIVVSSLTKVFSGETNVMGGSLVLNPASRHYDVLKRTILDQYEDTYWGEDAIYMERNSRDFAPRVHQINHNTERVCEFLRSKSQAVLGSEGKAESPIVVKEVFYPKWITPENYNARRIQGTTADPYTTEVGRAEGGYGGLFSITFTSQLASEVFFDSLPCEKGPSLGTNFTLASPYVILAHYLELDWAEEYGVERGLVRISVGLEDEEQLLAWFAEALKKAEEAVWSTQGGN